MPLVALIARRARDISAVEPLAESSLPIRSIASWLARPAHCGGLSDSSSMR